MTTSFGYRKVTSDDLPKGITSSMSLSDVQFYSPIFHKFFIMNENNANHVCLRYNRPVIEFLEKKGQNTYNVLIQDASSSTINTVCFVKCSPMFDPVRYLCAPPETHGVNENMQVLPCFETATETEGKNTFNAHESYRQCNNTAYIDGFFTYLSSLLLHEYKFVNAIDCHGLFIGLHDKLSINVIDDLEDLEEYEDFKNNHNVLYELGNSNSKAFKTFHRHSRAFKKKLNLKDMPECEPVAVDDIGEISNVGEVTSNDFLVEVDPSTGEIAMDGGNEEEEEGENDKRVTKSPNYTSGSSTLTSSSCSSRSSQTRTDETIDTDTDSESDSESENGSNASFLSSASASSTSSHDASSGCVSHHNSRSDGDEDDEYLYLDVYNMPSQIIVMERCENTVDSLLQDDSFGDAQISAMFAQLVLTLAAYQKAYKFTHNDLHCNNIMYTRTDRQYLHYCYNGVYYKVPTYGRIYKVIDFDRAIYMFQGKLYMGTCFKPGAVASNQYNYGEYYNANKPEIAPNMSFDLCRFACSIFDILVDLEDDYRMVKNNVKRIVMEWCMDDNGKSVLYKKNGVERYPDFKLYKMITRKVHAHTPEKTIQNEIFVKYVVKHNVLNKKTKIMNIDKMPELWRVCD